MIHNIEMVRQRIAPLSDDDARRKLLGLCWESRDDVGMPMNNKNDPRLAGIDRAKWMDRDPVIQIVDADGSVTMVTRKQADLPAPHIRRWLRINHTAGGAPIRMKILQPFKSADGVMFFPERIEEQPQVAVD